MKKVGILTLCSNNNFGNKLQNYAIITILKKYDITAETIWVENEFKSNNIKQYLKKIKRLFIDYCIEKNRNKKFIEFNKKLNIKKKIVFNNDMNKCSVYDYILVGSDQVWNPKFFNNNSIYLLSGYKGKKIAFSASFGVNNIPKFRIKDYSKHLYEFNMISVRENNGKEIIEDLTGRKDAEILIDPTMLLSSKEWDLISKKPAKLNSKKYILNYFLGELSDSRREEIERFAKENDCDVINILDKKDPLYTSGPSEFLYLEKNAYLICTDSFHSSVFAIIYDRPFIVYDREGNGKNMNSRIDTLLSTFKLENRKYNSQRITKENLKHNYTEAYEILKAERNKSRDFIKKALNIK